MKQTRPAAEVINCRCTLLQRTKWALGEGELKALKERAEYFGLDKTENFEDFMRKCIDVSKNEEYNEIKLSNAVPLSIRFLNSSEDLYSYAKNIKPIPGYEDIVIHGDKDGFAYKDGNGKEYYYSVHEFAEILKNNNIYKGGNIRLISCETGAEGATAAQALANLLNVEILAPDDIIYVARNGDLIVGFLGNGKWKIFKPGGEKQ